MPLDKGWHKLKDPSDELDEYIELFLDWIEYYLGCVTEFYARYGR